MKLLTTSHANSCYPFFHKASWAFGRKYDIWTSRRAERSTTLSSVCWFIDGLRVYSEKKLIHSSRLESTIILKSCLESIQISPDRAILIPIELWKWSGIKRRGNEKKTKERAAGTTENTGGFSVSKPCMEENNTIGLSLLRIISSIT